MTTTTKATFPVVGKQHGETIRRNAETGIEIRSSKLDRGGMEHSVYVPDAEHGYRLADYFGELISAREEAADRVVYLREAIAAAHSDAITENAERALAEHCPELLAVDTDPEDAAELTEYARKQFPSVAAMLDTEAEIATRLAAAVAADADEPSLPQGVELIEFGAADPSSYVYMLSGIAVEDMPKMEIAKRPRERKGRNGYVLAGWVVRVGGVEIDRKSTKRDARARLGEWLARHLAKVVTA